MFDDPHGAILAKLMDVASLRGKVHAANLANQNTPGYKAQRVAFDGAFLEALRQGDNPEGVQAVIEEGGGGPEQPDGNNVSQDREILEQAQNSAMYNSYISLAQGRKKMLTIAISTAPGG